MSMTNLLKNKRIGTVILLVAYLALAVMTLSCLAQQPGRDEYIEIGRISKENQQERLAKFSSYSVDRQIDVYLFAQTFVEGSNEDYGRYLAHNGAAKKREIALRIDSTDRMSFKTDLISVLYLIDLNCECVSNDTEIMDLLAKNELDILETDSLDVRISKGTYRKYLKRIKSRSK